MTSRRSKVRSRSLGQRSGQGHWVKGQGHWVRGQVKVTGSRSLGQRSGQGHWVRGQVKVTESKVKITGSKVRSRSAGDGHWNLVNTIVPAWTTEGIWTKTCRNISYIHATNFVFSRSWVHSKVKITENILQKCIFIISPSCVHSSSWTNEQQEHTIKPVFFTKFVTLSPLQK